MAVLNPGHLFEQADKLIAPPPAGPPRQVDLRRAVSAAYYGVFHAILTAAADEVVGVTKRTSRHYTLVYRSIDHRALRELCNEAKKQKLSPRYQRYAPASGFEDGIQFFASAFIELQEKRYSADYDPSNLLKTSDVTLVISTARSAVRRFETVSEGQRKAFVILLLFPPR